MQTKRLEDLCVDIISGGTPSTKEEKFWNGNIPWITSADINGSFSVNPKKFVSDQAKSKILPPNNILVVTRVGLGKIATNPYPLSFSQDIQGLILKDGNCLQYLLYALSTQVLKFKDIGRGATIKGVTREDLENINIPLPDLKTQQEIAHQLEQADKARQQRKAANALTDQFLQSSFLSLFGDPVKNEKGWELFTVEEIVRQPLQNGAYYPKEIYTDKKNLGVEMIHMSDAFYQKVSGGNLKRVLAPQKDIEKYSVTRDDLLIARRSLTFEGAAKPCLIDEYDQPMIFESSLIKISPDLKKVLPIYLFFFFSNEQARKAYLLKNVTSSTISGINQSNLARTEILVPPLSLQQQFAGIVAQAEQLRQKQRESERELENLFQSLLQRYFG
jgi:type I restriction enzyme S subunit